MKFLDSLLNIGTHFTPRDLPLLLTSGGVLRPEQITTGELQPLSDMRLPTQFDKFMSAVERQRREDMEIARFTGNYFKLPPDPVPLTPLQKTAIAYWRDVTDLQYPGAKPIQIEILRGLRRLNA